MLSCDIRIQDTTILKTFQTLESHADIIISEGRILETGTDLKEKYQPNMTIDGRGKLFMPGLIDSHMHTGQQLLKGLVLDAKPVIWTRIMLPFESTLTPEKMELSAELAALEMIKSGTTGFIDAGSYYMEDAARVYAESGLRGALSYSTMDEKGLPDTITMDASKAVGKTDYLYDNFHGTANLKVYYSLRALNSCSDRLIELAAEHARLRDTMLQAHMNEYQGEINGTITHKGMRPYEYLDKMHVLGKNFLGAHSLILSESEKSIIKERGVKVCHCPFSNCGKAIPDTPELLSMGIDVGLGTDGAAHAGLSLWNEMKIFRSIMNICHGVPKGNSRVMPAERILYMVLEGGAAALHEQGKLGRLERGCHADLISINLNQPHLCPTGNLIHTLIESVNAGDVEDMIVGGKLLMKGQNILVLDEEKILSKAKEYIKQNNWIGGE